MPKFFLLLLFFFIVPLFAEKSPSDVYSQSVVLERIVITLRKENGINEKLPFVALQKAKRPRHVLQKTLEVLTKVNKYRELKGYGSITLPPVPSRDITPEDVYYNVLRLKKEVAFLLKEQSQVKKNLFTLKKYTNKTPSDVYKVLWGISLGFDALIGQGFTPTDVYALSEQILKRVKFLRKLQCINSSVVVPEKKENLHPNHALYTSLELLKKIHTIEKKLWMPPVPIVAAKEKVISPTEVYDSLQTVNAELNRISWRLGVERHFENIEPDEEKTPSDVVQNLEFAIALLPSFDFNEGVNQYPIDSLKKSPNDVFALSEYILEKINAIKADKGIRKTPKETQYIYGLKPIHVYVKGIEALEKVQKLKILEGSHISESPESPDRKISPSEVYELILRLDDELSLLYPNSAKQAYREVLDKKEYSDKTPSDAYNNLWKITYQLDTILNQEYTPNETYVLALKINKDVQNIVKYFLNKKVVVKKKEVLSKRPHDVFNQSKKVLEKLEQIKKRGNIESVRVALPKDKHITPTSVYNALRIISATISEINVAFGIGHITIANVDTKGKTPSDVYEIVEQTNELLEYLFKDSSYEN